MSEKNTVEAVVKVLGNPVCAELSENALKVRRNLLIASTISLFIAIAGLKLDPGSTFLGLKFVGLTDDLIRLGLTFVTLYLLLHFIWYVNDSFLEWRLRVTGTRLSHVTTARLGSEHGDYPDDPRQSTFYHWWKDGAERIGNIRIKATTVDERLDQSERELRGLFIERGSNSNLDTVLNALTEARSAIRDLNNSVQRVEKILSSNRVPASLRRFDSWFEVFLRSQNMRWLLIDTLAPIILGTWALVALISQ